MNKRVEWSAALAMAVWLAVIVLAAGGAGRAVGPQSEPAAGKPHPELPDTKGETCLTCHEDVAKKAVPHAPVAGGDCTSCHASAGTGDATTVALAAGRSDNTAPLCTTCHDDLAKVADAPHPHGPAATGDCATCHDPHGGEQPKLLKSSQVELCGTCHDEQAGQTKKAVPHKPASAGCATCHDPHGGKNATLLRDGLNGLCLDCHALAPLPPGAPPRTSAPLGEGHAVSSDLLPMGRQLTLDRAGRGHPVTNHPTSAASDPLAKERPFTCVSCHQPHGSDQQKLLAFVVKPGEPICQKCHEM